MRIIFFCYNQPIEMIQFSEFDSRIIKQRVGKLSVQGLTPEILQQVRKSALEENLDWVFIRDRAFSFRLLHKLDWTGLELADVKVHLEASPTAAGLCTSDRFTLLTIRREAPPHLNALREIVHEIATRSRFARTFGLPAAQTVYDQWLDNSLAGQAATRIFIAQAGSKPAALITTQESTHQAELVLVGTHKDFQGQGAGSFLIQSVLKTLRDSKISQISVATQLDNVEAIHFYAKNGFSIQSYSADFHYQRQNERN